MNNTLRERISHNPEPSRKIDFCALLYFIALAGMLAMQIAFFALVIYAAARDLAKALF